MIQSEREPLELVLKKKIDCNQGAVRAVRFNIDGTYCLTSGSDKKIKLWNPKNGLLLKTYGGHADEISEAIGSSDSCHIVSASLDKSIIYWDVTTAQPLRRLRSHAGAVKCVAFNEESTVAVSGSTDNAVMCWDIRTRRIDPIQIMRDAKDTITAIKITENKIIASSLDGGIRQYDIRVGEQICDKLSEPVTYFVLTKDEQCTLAACLDGIVRLIDNDDGKILSEYEGHKTDDYHIECGVMSNDSQIITGSTEGCAVIYNLMDKTEALRLHMGEGVVNSLSTHPNRPDVVFAKRREIYFFGAYDPNEIIDDVS